MPRTGSGAWVAKAGFGAEKTPFTVWSSTTWVWEYGPSALIADSEWVAGSTTWSKVAFTASALNGVPSWKVTSSRRVKVYSVASAFTDMSVASPGVQLSDPWKR